MCVYCNRSQMTSQRVKNRKKPTRDEVEWRDCCFLSYGYTRRFESQLYCDERSMNKRNRRCMVCYTRRFISQ